MSKKETLPLIGVHTQKDIFSLRTHILFFFLGKHNSSGALSVYFFFFSHFSSQEGEKTLVQEGPQKKRARVHVLDFPPGVLGLRSQQSFRSSDQEEEREIPDPRRKGTREALTHLARPKSSMISQRFFFFW